MWAKLHDENDGQENVYFKSQTPYNYTEAKEYCNRQGDMKSTGVGTHNSQLWNFNSTANTLKNKIWTSDPDITWNIIDKGNNRVSIQKIIEEKDSNIPPDDNKNTTNIQKEQGVVGKTLDNGFKKVAKMVTYIVGAFGYNGNNVGARSEGEEQIWRPLWGPQLWIRKYEPSSGGYFTLEDPKSEKLLTAVNASFFALRGMFLLLRHRVEKGLFS